MGVAALTRHLAPADFGRYSVVQSLLLIVAGVAEAGLVNIAIAEYTQRRGDDRDSTLQSIQGLRLVLGLVAVVIALAFGLIAGYPSVMIGGIALMGAATVLQAVQATLAVPLNAGLRWGSATALEVLRQALHVGCILVLAAAGASLLPFYAVGIPVGIAVLAVNVVVVRRDVPLLPTFDSARWRELARMIAPYAAAVAVASIYASVASVTMSLVATAEEVGWFSASFRIYLVIAGIASLLVGAAFPILTRTAVSDRERHGYATNRLLTAMLIVGLWVALMTVVLAHRAIDIVAGPGYQPAVEVLQVQAIAIFASFLTTTVANVLISMRRFSDLLRPTGIALVISVVVTLALAGSQGARAGGVANAAAEVVNAILATWFLLRARRDLAFPFGLLPRLVIAAGLAALIAFVPVVDVVQAVLMTVVFFAVLQAMRAIPDELIDAVPFLRR